MKFCQHCIGPGPTYRAQCPRVWKHGGIGFPEQREFELCASCRYTLAVTKKLPEIHIRQRPPMGRGKEKPRLDQIEEK